MAGKLSKNAVDYRQAGLVARKRCGNCVMFRPAAGADRSNGACTLVAGRIRAKDVCDRWEAR